MREHSKELERAVLNCFLWDVPASRFAQDIDDSYFVDQRHKTVFNAVREVQANGEQPTALLVGEYLAQLGLLDKAGGYLYLTEIGQENPPTHQIETLISELAKLRAVRSLKIVGMTVAEKSVSDPREIESLIGDTRAKLEEIESSIPTKKTESVLDTASSAVSWIEDKKTSVSKYSGIETGYTLIDKYCGGLNKGELIILAARPSVGKSSLAMNIAQNVSSKGIATGIISLEMTSRDLMLRMIARKARIAVKRLRNNEELAPHEYERISKNASAISQYPIHINDTGGLGLDQIRRVARRMVDRQGCQLIVIDYMQLIAQPPRVQNQNAWITKVSGTVKTMCKEFSIPILCLSQLSRATEEKGRSHRPRLSDLRDSGAIEQDADIVMFIYRADMYNDPDKKKQAPSGIAEIIIDKNRNGDTGSFNLTFLPQFTSFENFQESEPDEKESQPF